MKEQAPHQEDDALFACFAGLDERADAQGGVGRAGEEQHEHGAAGVVQTVTHDHEKAGAKKGAEQTQDDGHVHPEFSLLRVAFGKNTADHQPCTGHARYETGQGIAGREQANSDAPHNEKHPVAEREVGHEIG